LEKAANGNGWAIHNLGSGLYLSSDPSDLQRHPHLWLGKKDDPRYNGTTWDIRDDDEILPGNDFYVYVEPILGWSMLFADLICSISPDVRGDSDMVVEVASTGVSLGKTATSLGDAVKQLWKFKLTTGLWHKLTLT
jgi:hypothetical protein